ncbi:DUF3703 domain-containing protein [Embleya hyalina]|uniref:DUF3703 domain-containing protein n=1 Tax=Embleya hyalina TaxID=516124 RepID=UPI001FE52B7A|nr:DUF3703 domain-containing protein [Embleya hyalina]
MPVAAPGFAAGKYPSGNTGRARVGLTAPMPSPTPAGLLRDAGVALGPVDRHRRSRGIDGDLFEGGCGAYSRTVTMTGRDERSQRSEGRSSVRPPFENSIAVDLYSPRRCPAATGFPSAPTPGCHLGMRRDGRSLSMSESWMSRDRVSRAAR